MRLLKPIVVRVLFILSTFPDFDSPKLLII